jgi:hypothetical protein
MIGAGMQSKPELAGRLQAKGHFNCEVPRNPITHGN